MLPSFLQLNDAPRVVQVPPPPRFRPIRGPLHGVWIGAEASPFKGRTSAQKNGLKFEEKVHRRLREEFGSHFMKSPRLHFMDGDESRTCVPDGIALRPGVAVIVEIKSQHMPEAWWQLRKLYEPVVRQLYPGRVLLLEICKTYDALMPFPEEFTFVDPLELSTWVHFGKDGTLGVLRWKL